jgi:hypothetical protein
MVLAGRSYTIGSILVWLTRHTRFYAALSNAEPLRLQALCLMGRIDCCRRADSWSLNPLRHSFV